MFDEKRTRVLFSLSLSFRVLFCFFLFAPFFCNRKVVRNVALMFFVGGGAGLAFRSFSREQRKEKKGKRRKK